MFKNFINDERGWITWVWSKMGVMIAFFVALIIFISIYHNVCKINDADMANQISRDFSDTVSQVYAGGRGYKTVYELPANINGHKYEAIVVEKPSEKIKGIVIHVYKGNENVSGGASFPEIIKLDLTKITDNVLHDKTVSDATILCLWHNKDRIDIWEVDTKKECVGQ